MFIVALKALAYIGRYWFTTSHSLLLCTGRTSAGWRVIASRQWVVARNDDVNGFLATLQRNCGIAWPLCVCVCEAMMVFCVLGALTIPVINIAPLFQGLENNVFESAFCILDSVRPCCGNDQSPTEFLMQVEIHDFTKGYPVRQKPTNVTMHPFQNHFKNIKSIHLSITRM